MSSAESVFADDISLNTKRNAKLALRITSMILHQPRGICHVTLLESELTFGVGRGLAGLLETWLFAFLDARIARD
jgi:hypothetical protein